MATVAQPVRPVGIPMRPRTTGELLDDAWRLSLLFYPQLLLLSALFLVPAFGSLLILLAKPSPVSWSWIDLLPLVTATLFALTGIGSGACQTWLNRYAHNRPLRVSGCLLAGLRNGFRHCVAQAMLLAGLLLGTGCAIMPGIMLWLGFVSLHVLIVEGKGASFADLSELGQEVRTQPGKTTFALLSRIPLLILLIANLHLFLQALLWTASNLASLDVAFLGSQLVLSNSLYLVSLTLFAWMLLAPYAESVNFLLHLDTRVRREGLDLLYRVQRLFPASAKASVVLLVGWMTMSGYARADFEQTLQTTREQVRQIHSEIQQSDPYPGGDKWVSRLHRLEQSLTAASGSPNQTRWFARAIHGFAKLDKAGAMQVLHEIETRLTRQGKTTHPGRDAIKKLLRPLSDEDKSFEREPEPKTEQQESERDVEQAPPPSSGSKKQKRTRSAPSQGLSQRGWLFLGGVLAVLVMFAVWLSWRQGGNVRSVRRKREAGQLDDADPEVAPAPHERSAEVYWREAERLARAGQHRDAVRSLYLMVLGMLHRARLLKYEAPRTNGEYLRQVRLAAHAPTTVQEPFAQLVRLFETKWYGERTCTPEEYHRAHALADSLRNLVEGR